MKSAEAFLQQLNLNSGSSGRDVSDSESLESGFRGEGYAEDLGRRIEARAVALLATREHGAKELRSKLTSKFPETAEMLDAAQEPPGLVNRLIDGVLERCRENNWQSDERYIEQAVRNYMAKGHGPMKIRQKLQQNCRDSGLIDAYLDLDDEEWLELAREALIKKYRDLRKPDRRNEQAKRMRFLQGRGFPPALIWKAFR